jgi:hypothetical protein
MAFLYTFWVSIRGWIDDLEDVEVALVRVAAESVRHQHPKYQPNGADQLS